jgi:hypothetical protein
MNSQVPCILCELSAHPLILYWDILHADVINDQETITLNATMLIEIVMINKHSCK